jgi:hypothetical protein
MQAVNISSHQNYEESEADSPFSKCYMIPLRPPSIPGFRAHVNISSHQNYEESEAESLFRNGSIDIQRGNACDIEKKKEKRSATSIKGFDSAADDSVRARKMSRNECLQKMPSLVSRIGRRRKEDECNKMNCDEGEGEDVTEIDIISNQKAWKLLSTTKYGLKRIKSFYCLPNVIPDGGQFKLGYDYFHDLESLRLNLCAYGLPDPNKNIIDDHELRTWLRLAVFSQVQGLNRVPSYEPLKSFSKAWNFLKKIGFKYSHITGYTFPRKEANFEDTYDFVRHLSRFGLPTSAAVQEIDQGALLALEMHIADFPEEKRESW